MRYVVAVPEEQLQRMLSGLQLQHRRGLCFAEMQVLVRSRNWLIQWRQWCIYHQVMVAGTRVTGASRCQRKAFDTEFNRDR